MKKCTVAVLTGDNPSYISVYLLSISTGLTTISCSSQLQFSTIVLSSTKFMNQNSQCIKILKYHICWLFCSHSPNCVFVRSMADKPVSDNNLSINLRHVLTLTTPITLFLISDVYLMISFSNRLSLIKFPRYCLISGLAAGEMEVPALPHLQLYSVTCKWYPNTAPNRATTSRLVTG